MPAESPTYCVVFRDEDLNAEVPLYVDLEKLDVFDQPPLSFQLSDGLVLTEDQLKELAEVVAEVGPPGPGITRTFFVVLNLIHERLASFGPQVDAAQNEAEQMRLGRIISIASRFDDGVALWVDHWRRVLFEVDGLLGKATADDGTDERVAVSVVEKLDHLLKGMDGITATVKDLARQTQLPPKQVLNLEEAALMLNRSSKYLRKENLLNDLSHDFPFDPNKLNGHRKGKGERAPWDIDINEVMRFKSYVIVPMPRSSEDGGDNIAIRGT